MARTRSGGGGAAFAWSLVIVGTGFFIFMILFIVTYTQNDKYQQEAAEAKRQLDQFANATQRSSTDVQEIISKMDTRSRETVVSKLMDERTRLKAMITPEAGLDVDAVLNQKVTQKQVDGPLLTAVDQLRQELAAARQQTETARSAQAAAEKRASDANAERDKLAAGFNANLARITATSTETNTALATATAGFPAMKDSLRTEMEGLRAQMQSTIDGLVAQNEEKDAIIADLRGRLAILETRKSDTLGPPELIPADGLIISLVPEQNKVYINRGSEDFLQLGMTFEVFGADELIKLNNYDELRGKATIEILDLDARTAVARIVRQVRGQTITPNDQIANLIYDPNASFKFHVYGDFDIDNSGLTSIRDRDRIKSMITRWGGQVTDDLNWDVDFLVLGREPAIPDPLPADVIDPTIIRAHAEAMRNYETYVRLTTTARELSVPVLNQNRFLALVGYYRR